VVAGLAAFKNHLAYRPHSGTVLADVGDQLAGYECASGSLHFAIDEPVESTDVVYDGLDDERVVRT
jgi:uncharacterized protein YdhG (YjbR/CyaY superfamily)